MGKKPWVEPRRFGLAQIYTKHLFPCFLFKEEVYTFVQQGFKDIYKITKEPFKCCSIKLSIH